ncbi:hypothetical protein [Bacillus cereus]|uniref:hypothetical protein n=1 Tax=Bacillus cereus TaxID=1396 RepID=UPI000BF268AC|nr:hypothetical protein [Bacillus cereus]PFL46653.1 hypothetical protein COJ33_27475 [Bacillus cereus]
MFDVYDLDKKIRYVYEKIDFVDKETLVQRINNYRGGDSFVDDYFYWKDVYNYDIPMNSSGLETDICDKYYLMTGKIQEIKIDNISYEFAKLKTESDIVNFAQKYGMLGIKFDDEGLQSVGSSYFEPFEIWKETIKNFVRVLKLYRALAIGEKANEKIEDNLLILKADTHFGDRHYVQWYDKKPTGFSFKNEELDNLSFIDIGRKVLIQSVENYINPGIEIRAAEVIDTEKSRMGFYITERRETKYLITAIYYDLWQQMNANVSILICENPKCQLPYMKVKRQKYCCDACKQEAYRLRKEKGEI